ncbi:MAG: hypothetical protein NC416_00245 [Eubacterium sp.]|nr:hypothetical protein [Eubacterium sp.]
MDTGIELQGNTGRESFEDWIRDVLGKIKGDKIDVAALIYDRIQKEADQAAAFQYFLENADEIVSTEEKGIKRFFTAEEVQELQRKCATLIVGIMDKLLLENIPVQEFYRRLWAEGICKNTLLQDEKEKIYALYRIWQDRRIPYYQLDHGMEMSNEEFKEYCEKNKQLIKKAFFIINSSIFSQRSQQGDLLIRVLDECKTNADKVIVMTQILSSVERNVLLGLFEAMDGELPED